MSRSLPAASEAREDLLLAPSESGPRSPASSERSPQRRRAGALALAGEARRWRTLRAASAGSRRPPVPRARRPRARRAPPRRERQRVPCADRAAPVARELEQDGRGQARGGSSGLGAAARRPEQGVADGRTSWFANGAPARRRRLHGAPAGRRGSTRLRRARSRREGMAPGGRTSSILRQRARELRAGSLASPRARGADERLDGVGHDDPAVPVAAAPRSSTCERLVVAAAVEQRARGALRGGTGEGSAVSKSAKRGKGARRPPRRPARRRARRRRPPRC